MIDKLILLSSSINDRFVDLALEEGMPTRGYERCLDLRDAEVELPVRLYYRGRRTGIHKIEIIGVAKLGLPRTKEIVKSIFPDADRVKIYRIDLCVDLLGIPARFFLLNCRMSRRQNFAIFKSRGALSFYPGFSKQSKVLIYNRLEVLKKEGNPLASVFVPDDCLTRIEAQLSGSAVPFRRLQNICRYAEFDPFQNLRFEKLRVGLRTDHPKHALTAIGLRSLISNRGVQAVAKGFSPQQWAYIEKSFLEPMLKAELPPLGPLVKKSTQDWLAGRIRFPRGPVMEMPQ